MNKAQLFTSTSLIIAIALSGCATNGSGGGMSNTKKGALIGAASGALIGLLAKDKKKGALIGAVGGGVAGAAVGAYMDKQKQDFEKLLAAERDQGAINIEKLPEDVLMVRMTSQTAFESDSSDVKEGFKSTMDKIAKVVSKYEKTQLAVIGHSDSRGSEVHNQTLSEKRAKAVYQYLAQQGVISERLQYSGKGESDPIASNDTENGRAENRRVELYVVPIVEEENSDGGVS